jgi:cell division protease FtsH
LIVINFSGVSMKNFRLSRAIASILAISIVLSAPGPQAWGQVAATVRPGSVGTGMTGTAGSITPGSFAVPSLSLSAPSLSLSAPSISAPSLAPVPAALSAAVIPAAATPAVPVAPIAVAPAALSPMMPAASKPAALTASLSAASAQLTPASDKKADGALGRLSAFFDGLVARRPAVDAVDAPNGTEAERGSGLGNPRQAYIPVLVTLADPGSIEALGLVLTQLHKDAGFLLDDAFGAVRGPGVITVRGAVPLTSLEALTTATGVVKVAPASGRIHLTPAAPAAIPAAPVRENLLRAGMRNLIMTKPLLGVVAMLPLQFAIMVAFMGPVMGGIALGGAAAVLKPWMLGTAFGMAATFSYLAPLFSWIPLKLRVAATYGAAGMLAWTFYAMVPGLPAIWLAANLLLSLLATRGLAARTVDGKNPVDKAVNSTERAAFVNLLGYQALLPILILGGMMPLAFGILAVSTALALALLIKARAKPAATALSVNPPSAPSTPEGPNLSNLRFRSVVTTRPKHEPFVPATRVVADMEKLLQTDPAAALKAAAAAIVNEKERRSEVKIGAQRILDGLPIDQTLPHYLDLLKLTARAGVQTSKDVNIDPWWYLQRTALKRLSRDAAALKPGTPELIDALKTTYKDRNASVRLAAADALTALGVDPGPEVSYEGVSLAPSPMMQPAQNLAPAPQGPKKKSGFMKWVSILVLAGALGWMAFGGHAPTNAPPANPPAISQTIGATDAAKAPAAAVGAPAAGVKADVKPADTVKADPKDAALDQIAKDTKRTADAAERSAKAAEEMAKPKGSFLSTLFWTLAPIILMVWLFRKFTGGMGGGAAGGIGQTAKLALDKPTTRFDDVAGIDESLVEVQEIMDFLRDPARFKKLGARMPKGILMEGPPGTGKTLLARALAGETDATFISISGSDFVELYVGNGARKVRALFDLARQNAPAIIFIDEIDAVGKKRGDGGPGGGGNDEREQTINQILKEMDGFDNSSGVLVVAATNRIDTLDAALTRPGRFDRKIHVGLPEAMGREAILALHAKKARLGADVDLRLIARRTAGLSGAYLENVINEAALLAARRGADSISASDIDEAVDRATIGGKRSLRLSDALKRRIAAHEAGHVLANLLNEKPEVRVPVNKVTIMPHGSGALGFAESGSEEGDKYLYTRAELEARLDTALGGLVAEHIFYGEWSTGPGSDLESATRVARAMVQQLGMSPEMGLAQTTPNQYGQSSFGGETDAKALVEINKLLEASRARVEARLRAGADKHKAMIEALMEKETLSADEIEAIAHPKPKP